MQIVIDKESIIHLFSVAIYVLLGEPYKDIKEVVADLVENLDYTELPKGHGRLGDLDELEDYIIEKYSEGEQLAAIDISDAPTIIEADEESKE